MKSTEKAVNNTFRKYGRTSTKRENEMCGVTALVYGFDDYPTKNKLQY